MSLDRPEPLRRRCNHDEGFTLVEVLVSLVVLSIGIVALMGGLATAIFGSGLHRNEVEADAAAIMASEVVKSMPYVPCKSWGATTYYPTLGGTINPLAFAPAGFTSSKYKTWPTNSVTSTGYFTVTEQAWEGEGVGFQTVGGSSGFACPTVDDMQQVVITAVAAGNVSQTIYVLKGSWV